MLHLLFLVPLAMEVIYMASIGARSASKRQNLQLGVV